MTTPPRTGTVGSTLQGDRDRRDREQVEPAAISRAVDLAGKRVLDVGCGTGRLTRFVARHAAFVYAFDPSADSVDEARSAVAAADRDRVRFAVHGADALDVPRERFDLALCGWSLWCLPTEGVVNALRRIHAALVPGGLVVDTQPVAPWPPVTTPAGEIGALDLRGWVEIVAAVDEQVDETIEAGLFAVEHHPGFVVADTFVSGAALVDTVKDWQGARIPRELADRLASHDATAQLHQEVRIRVLRALQPGRA